MVRGDKWKQRPSVMRYRAFKDEVRLRIPQTLELHGSSVTFGIPVPKSWTKKKKAQMLGEYHQQTPDLDNLIKALGDAMYSDDSHIARICATKVWAEDGFIEILGEKDGSK
jgi:Holliday junction resolvase RusA-like endonuclease